MTAHEKRIAPIAATQPLTSEGNAKMENAFLPKGKNHSLRMSVIWLCRKISLPRQEKKGNRFSAKKLQGEFSCPVVKRYSLLFLPYCRITLPQMSRSQGLFCEDKFLLYRINPGAILTGKNQRFLLGVTVKPIPRPKGKGQTTPLERIVGLEYESGQSRNSGNRHFIA